MKLQHELKDRRDDLYETHPDAVLALLTHQPLRQVIWEPCAGRGAISSVLMDHGHTVISQDLVKYYNSVVAIETGVDFLMEFQPPHHEVKQIVTNPPYKLADAFIRKGLSLGCDCIMLLPITYMAGYGRSDIIDQHLSHVLLGKERLPFMHRDGYEGSKTSSSMMNFGWFYFVASPLTLLQQSFTVKRISWRGHASRIS